MKRHARTLPLFITMVAMLAFAAPGYGSLAKPTVTAPTNGGSTTRSRISRGTRWPAQTTTSFR